MTSPIDLVIEPRVRDLGDGFTVKRVLPFAKRRQVGPFVFVDQMGPVEMAPGVGLDVRPHPHIGLATVTYLFEGEILHRDVLGSIQTIKPGDVNWMTAGRGIAHSERTGDDRRASGQRLYGIQSWVALPEADQETGPNFTHHPKSTLPEIALPGVRLRLIAGTAYGATAPARVYSPTFYLDAQFEAGSRLAMPDEYAERAIYVVSGEVSVAGERYGAGHMLVFKPDMAVEIEALAETRAMLLGGATLDGGPRLIWWNFVSNSQARIDQAKADWREGRFGQVPGETEFIPLPEG